MGRSRLFTAVFLFLVLAGIGLAWVIYQQLEASAPPNITPTKAAQAPEIPSLPPLPEFSMEPLVSFAAVVDRPVFSRSRRPPDEAVLLEAAPSSTLDLTLKGVIYSEGERIALFSPKDRKEILRLAEGGSYRGWELVEMTPNEVRFRRGTREEVLALIFETPPSFVPKQKKDRRRARTENNNRDRDRDGRDGRGKNREEDDEAEAATQ